MNGSLWGTGSLPLPDSERDVGDTRDEVKDAELQTVRVAHTTRSRGCAEQDDPGHAQSNVEHGESHVAPQDPASPHVGHPTGQTQTRNSRRLAFIEDAEWMAGTGETMPGAAARLRLHPHSLRNRLHRAGRSDLWARLVANADPGYPVTGSIRRAA